METNDKHPNIQMIHGSSGQPNYAAFARKGKFALAIKPNAIASGKSYGGAENTAYFGARLRSCYGTELGDPKDNIEFVGLDFSTAWPNVEFDKKNMPDRSSTQIGTFLRGDLENNPEELLNKLQDPQFSIDMANYLIGLAGSEYAIVTVEELAAFLRDIYAKHINSIIKYVEANKSATLIQQKMAEHSEANIGVFGIQSQQLKQMKEAAGIKDKSPEDVEDTDDDSNDGDYEGGTNGDYD